MHTPHSMRTTSTGPTSLSHLSQSSQIKRVFFPQQRKALCSHSKAYVCHQKQRHQSNCCTIAKASSSSDSAPGTTSSFTGARALDVRDENGDIKPAPAQAGIYAFYDKEGQLQYIGLSRKVGLYQATGYKEPSIICRLQL